MFKLAVFYTPASNPGFPSPRQSRSARSLGTRLLAHPSTGFQQDVTPGKPKDLMTVSINRGTSWRMSVRSNEDKKIILAAMLEQLVGISAVHGYTEKICTRSYLLLKIFMNT